MLLLELIDLHFKTNNIIIIEIDEMMFQVVLDGNNIYWGMVPKTNTKEKIDQLRDTTGSSHIMKRLIPLIKRAINLILNKNNMPGATIVGRTKKSWQLYQSWKNDFPGYVGEDYISNTGRGIFLKKTFPRPRRGWRHPAWIHEARKPWLRITPEHST